MGQIRNTGYYAKILAKKHKIPLKIMNKLLTFGMKNICKCIQNGEDIRIPGFGHIYSNKRKAAEAVAKYNKLKDERK